MQRAAAILLLLLVAQCTCLENLLEWSQVGGDVIPGSYLHGQSMAVSADGAILAVGTPGHEGSGRVQVYGLTASGWTPLGAAINGEASGDDFGSSVALSADGEILAVGAPRHNGVAGDTGRVQVFQLVDGTWAQLGGNIDGQVMEDKIGSVIALSGDGGTLAVHISRNVVRVYRYLLLWGMD